MPPEPHAVFFGGGDTVHAIASLLLGNGGDKDDVEPIAAGQCRTKGDSLKGMTPSAKIESDRSQVIRRMLT